MQASEGASGSDEEGPQRPSRPRREAAGNLDDLIEFFPSESDESEDEDLYVDDEELARQAADLIAENEAASAAPPGHVMHPQSGLLYDARKYELRKFSQGKTPAHWWRYDAIGCSIAGLRTRRTRSRRRRSGRRHRRTSSTWSAS